MTVHELKCWPKPFQATFEGKKLFEIRTNDRDYKVGDIIELREFVHRVQFDAYPLPQGRELDEPNGYYTGRRMRHRITHVEFLQEWMSFNGVDVGVWPYQYVVLGISEL